MIRLLLSLIILTLIITYLVIPFIKHVRKFAKKEGQRFDKQFTEDDKK